MEDVKKIASYILKLYKKQEGKDIDLLKLQKLLYFAQRESYILKGEPMIACSFYAGTYGPVVLEITKLFKASLLNDVLPEKAVKEYSAVFDKIMMHYAKKDSWSLSTLSHGELSWRSAFEKNKDGKYSKMDDELIKKDAQRIKLRRAAIKQND